MQRKFTTCSDDTVRHFADKPYLVMIGAAILAMAVSLYSKKVFVVLEKESAVK
jgi:hypothetical protein